MRKRCAAGQVLHRDHQHFLARGSGEGPSHQLLDDGIRRGGCRAGAGGSRPENGQPEHNSEPQHSSQPERRFIDCDVVDMNQDCIL